MIDIFDIKNMKVFAAICRFMYHLHTYIHNITYIIYIHNYVSISALYNKLLLKKAESIISDITHSPMGPPLWYH